MRPLTTCSAVLFLIGSSLAATTPAKADFYSGNLLYRDCTAERGEATYYQSIAQCTGYIMGTHDALSTAGEYLSYAAEIDPPLRLICVPETVEAGQLRDLVVIYLRDNPANRNLSAGLLVMLALREAYPCGTGA